MANETATFVKYARKEGSDIRLETRREKGAMTGRRISERDH